MIEMSGIGTYIQHLMGQGIYDYALGDETLIRRYDKDVKVIPYSASIYSPKEQLLFPKRAVREAGIGIIHFPHYNVPMFYRGRYVVTVHDLTHIVMPEYLGSRAKYLYAKLLMGNALKHAEHVFTVSKNSRKDIERYFHTDHRKISITYNAIDDDFRVKDPSETDYLYDKYDIPQNTRKLLYVGNLKPHKNLITLLRAVKRLHREDITLLLVGKAFKSVDLEEEEKQLGIDGQVIHTGMVDKEELIDLYNLADLFVFPSLYEGFGIPPLEAMACGTPVIAANNSSIPEVVSDAAILFDGHHSKELSIRIREVLDQEELRQELIEKGLIRSHFFNWSQARAEVRRVFENTSM